MSTSNTLMVVAVLAVAVAVFGVFANLFVVQSSGYASDTPGNITFEIFSKIDINFTQNIINWSVGYVDTTQVTDLGCNGAVEATLSTDPPNTVVCGINWVPQDQGLILQSDSNQDIRVNLSSDTDALTLIDGGVSQGSDFLWKAREQEASSCNPDGVGLGITSYTDIVSGLDIVLCDSMNSGTSNNELELDFSLNISSGTTVIGERKAIITATAIRSDFQVASPL